MSTQYQRDMALIGRYGGWLTLNQESHRVWHAALTDRPHKPKATNRDPEQAVHGVAMKLHAWLCEQNQEAAKKAADTCLENRRVMGDWSKD